MKTKISFTILLLSKMTRSKLQLILDEICFGINLIA